jgi:hypothetical protein
MARSASAMILGDNIGYWVGRSFGRSLLLKYGHYAGIGTQKLALGEYLFMRYGGAIVFFGRFVALLRVYAALLAGIKLRSALLLHPSIGSIECSYLPTSFDEPLRGAVPSPVRR